MARTLLEPHAFKTLFLMLLQGIKEYKQEEYYLRFQNEISHFFVLVIVKDFSVKDQMHCALQELQIPYAELAYADVKIDDTLYLGYIYSTLNFQQREQLRNLFTQRASKSQI